MKYNTYRDENGDPVDLNGLVDQLQTATVNYAFVSDHSISGVSGFNGLGCTDNTILWDQTMYGAQQPKCEHVMGDETETEDGQVVGFCTLCGDKIRGRRMVGGYGLARLKDAIVDALGDMEAMAGLLEEIDRVELMLRVEEQALKSAHDMVNMAREMVEKIVLPERDEDAA